MLSDRPSRAVPSPVDRGWNKKNVVGDSNGKLESNNENVDDILLSPLWRQKQIQNWAPRVHTLPPTTTTTRQRSSSPAVSETNAVSAERTPQDPHSPLILTQSGWRRRSDSTWRSPLVGDERLRNIVSNEVFASRVK